MSLDAGEGEVLMSVQELERYFDDGISLLDRLFGESASAVRAVDGVSFDIHRGETLGLVGESGCGKSTVGETILRLQEPTAGSVAFDGENLEEREDLTEFRRNAQILFQDPFSSLDPRMPVGQSIRQPLDIHDWPQDAEGDPAERKQQRVEELMERVGLSADQLDRYPSEFSGGQLQRIGIARALALDPDFLVLDEPTSALDVSVQAQILNLLADLQSDFGLTYLFISHDLGVIRYICDRIAVMYLGEIVETAPAEQLFTNPRHPYTEALLESVPRVDLAERERDIDPLAGDVPSPRDPPSGCRFRTRCPKVIPPDDIRINQEEFRVIMDVRDRIADREIAVEQVRADTDGDTDRAADRLYDRLVDTELPDQERQRVHDALVDVTEGNWGRAGDRLRERYESVCETDHPTGEVSCHLFDD
ncbi:MAG: ABC-type oligopeptide transport system, ATPase component [halophilic archaeon J07HX64]|jgi:ABC-type oligopeptide transport system, ATPase component|nr:MAG: ABC-type oligopeptide transport system, ATPase component [halophilic archaeon J07HX64]